VGKQENPYFSSEYQHIYRKRKPMFEQLQFCNSAQLGSTLKKMCVFLIIVGCFSVQVSTLFNFKVRVDLWFAFSPVET